MSTSPRDQDALTAGHQSTRAVRTATRRVLLFEFARGEHRYRCDLLDHGTFGVEAQFAKNGEFFEGRLLETSTLAAMWADARRKAIEGTTDDQ